MSLRTTAILTAFLVFAGGAGACHRDGKDADGAASGKGLIGLFSVAPGVCSGVRPEGSYFRMVQPGGTASSGPFVPNADADCNDKTVTPLHPGTDGGLKTGTRQPAPPGAFDAQGNATADRIIQPQPWLKIRFGLATSDVDPQAKVPVPPPVVEAAGRVLRGDLRGLVMDWDGQHFNQGAPKPTGDHGGATSDPRGAFDAATGAYTLEWSSQILGGPFANYIGVWHFEGTFTKGQ